MKVLLYRLFCLAKRSPDLYILDEVPEAVPVTFRADTHRIWLLYNVEWNLKS